MPDLRSRTLKSLCIFFVCFSGCEVWRPLPTTDAELEKGLVVLYPGSFNTVSEMVGFYWGFREAGIDQAIEVVQWAPFLDHYYDPEGSLMRVSEKAAAEAARIVAYQQAHPGRPVTLLGFSGGCFFSVRLAESLPEGAAIDRIILMSPAIDRGYDLTAALARTREGIVNFWSPLDQFTRDRSAEQNLADTTKGDPASSFGFDMQDERLMQIEYDPAWAQYGHYGEHSDYLPLVGWIGQFVAPWVAKASPNASAVLQDPHGF